MVKTADRPAGRVKFMAELVELWPIEKLLPYANNARVHTDEQVAQIAASIEEFGFTIPILVAEDGLIIAGHGRLLAAMSLGMPELPVIVARGWTEEQRRAYTLADNQLVLAGSWDEDLLKAELSALRDLDVDLSLTGFDSDGLALILTGWDSDIQAVQKAGEHTEGITSTIKVTVAQAEAKDAEGVIHAALRDAGIEFK